MAGDPSKASLWADADVYVASTLSTANPTDSSTAFGAGWGLVGLLDGEAGFVHARSQDTSDFFAWGGVLVRSSRRNFKQTTTFTALEDNDVTRDLIWPGSTATALFVPKPVPVKIALEKREGDRVHRLITAQHAVIDLNSDVTESEADLTKYELLATIYPKGDGQLWVVQDSLEEA